MKLVKIDGRLGKVIAQMSFTKMWVIVAIECLVLILILLLF